MNRHLDDPQPQFGTAEYMRVQQIGAYRTLKQLAVEICLALDEKGYKPDVGDTVKQLIENYAKGINDGDVEIPRGY